jgi:hypothetical protein
MRPQIQRWIGVVYPVETIYFYVPDTREYLPLFYTPFINFYSYDVMCKMDFLALSASVFYMPFLKKKTIHLFSPLVL